MNRLARRNRGAMLTFGEEIMLLVLDDETGAPAPIGQYALNLALSGAVLMDLALRSRIDTDLESLTVIDRSKTGEDILDSVLQRIDESKETRSTRFWVEEIAMYGPEIKEDALKKLVSKGILKEVGEKFLWVFETRRYPMIDASEEREVKRRLLDVILSDEIPDPRDVVLICLVDACSLFSFILSDRELRNASERIAQIKKLDLIGQAVAKAVEQLRVQIAMAMAHTPG
jgi:Golgi phosphoprotein 3